MGLTEKIGYLKVNLFPNIFVYVFLKFKGKIEQNVNLLPL